MRPNRTTGEGPNPSGLCMCGCGQPTPLARCSDRNKGHVLGKPVRFLPNHHRRLPIRIEVNENGCWVWQGTTNGKGYGSHYWNGRLVGAHRFMYETMVGPIPDGLEIDHACRNRLCVNPAHLEPVTHAENIRRADYSNRKRTPRARLERWARHYDACVCCGETSHQHAARGLCHLCYYRQKRQQE